MHALEDGGTIISHRDFALLGSSCSSRCQDLVHAFGSEGGLDQVSDSHSTHEVPNPGDVSLLFVTSVLQDVRQHVLKY